MSFTAISLSTSPVSFNAFMMVVNQSNGASNRVIALPFITYIIVVYQITDSL
jgi:hypothetical protein